MSLSRSVMEELCEFVSHKPSAVLGNKFFDCRAALHVDISHKADKFESKLLVFSKFRLFFVVGKSPSTLKVERSYHLLSIRGIHLSKEDELILSFEESQSKKRFVIRSGATPAMRVALHVLTALKHYFPDIGVQLRTQVDLVPTSLYDDFQSLALDAAARPCHSFRRTYAALCDFYEQPYREEVSWDVEKIYTINNLRTLRIDDFSHLLPRDLLPIVGVLQFSSYFYGLVADGVRILPELLDIILSVIRKSPFLTLLHLRNCALPRDFISLFSHSVEQCSVVPLESLDLSKNFLDDKKGFGHLCTVFPKLTSLRNIKLSECNLSDRSVHSLCSALYNNLTSSKPSSVHSLTHLNLAYSTIKDEVSSLINLVSLCVSLRILDLSDTSFPLDKLWPALKYGGLQIEKLSLGGCHAAKKGNESGHTMKEFFSMAVNLTSISFSNTLLSPELLKGLLLGLSSNQQLRPYDLNLDGCCEKGCGPVLEACLGGLQCRSISLRDNNLEGDLQGVVRALHSVSTLKKVDLGGNNLVALRRSSKPAHATTLNRILLDIVKLCADDSPVEELILSKCQLGSNLSVILNTLGVTTSLRYLDISGNEMTNFGARILSKALQLNVSLRAISIDNNKIGADGFVDLAAAMQINYTLTSVPYPINDLFDCRARNEHGRAIVALTQIEASLERNRSVDSIEMANSKKALNGGIQSLLDGGSAVACEVEDVFAKATREGIPPRIDDMVKEFVEQLRQEASSMIQESISRLGDGPIDCAGDIVRAEKVAVNRLQELWLKDVKVVISDWRWRELCERSELSLRATCTGNSSLSSASVEGSPLISSPRILKSRSSDVSHRPKSVFGDIAAGNTSPRADAGINLDAPPSPSSLTHIQKARPRKRTGRSVGTGSDSSSMNRSTELGEIDEEEPFIKAEGEPENHQKKPLSERAGFRPAMMPELSLVSSVQLRSVTERVTSPKSRDPPCPVLPSAPDGSPPPLPSRNRDVTSVPPVLPPKPEPRMRQTLAAASEDEQNANSRLSVADMTRMFNR